MGARAQSIVRPCCCAVFTWENLQYQTSFQKKSEKVLAQLSRFPYSTFSLQGGVAQLGERLTGSQEVRGSIPLVSTTCFFLSLHGGVAQLGERLTGSQEVRGSIPLVSTMRFKARAFALAFLFSIFKILYISYSEMHVRIL